MQFKYLSFLFFFLFFFEIDIKINPNKNMIKGINRSATKCHENVQPSLPFLNEKDLYNYIYILHEDILSQSLEKYITYHPCLIIIHYISKKGL